MKIIVMDGSLQDDSRETGTRAASFTELLRGRGHSVDLFPLGSMDIHPCTGCFSCWFRTPGRCVIPDEMESLYRSITQADLAVFSSPLSMGLFSSRLKNALDRLIPLVLPHLTIISGEMHHHPRYVRRPLLAAVVGEEPDTEQEDLEIVRNLFERNALNLGGRLALFRCWSEGEEAIADAIDSL